MICLFRMPEPAETPPPPEADIPGALITEPAQPLAPVPPDERISLIDVLRGIALFGIIMANMRGFAGPLGAYFRPQVVWKSPSDFWVQAFIDTFVQGKFITIFAFLFGLGFAVQFTRAEKRHSRFGQVFSRRLLGLLLIGAAHQLFFWWGDILVGYAIGGFLLIPFRKRRDKTLLIWAVAVMLLPIAVATGFNLYKRLRPDDAAKAAENKRKAAEDRAKADEKMQASIKIYQTGSYPAIFRERLNDLKREARVLPFTVMLTFPMFLLGVWVWRRGIFQEPERYRHRMKRWMAIGFAVGIPLNVASTWGSRLLANELQFGPPSPLMTLNFLLAIIGRPALSMAYACVVALLFLDLRWRARLMPFAAVGRTALSNYLLQTVICTTLFYGYGGGLFLKVDEAWLLVPTVAIYALQAPLSNWWLAHHRYGPMEWVWRRMTYGRRAT